ncbi:GDSL esterase/lipase [Rosa sericea]
MTYNVLWLFLSLDLIFTSALAIIKLPKNATVPAVFMFGDSIVDTGNNNNLTTIIKSNFPPYGRDFPGGVPTGRFSNGKVASDFVVEELGVKEYLPAYLDPDLQETDLLTGVNFASSGSGYDPLTSTIMNAMPLSKQLDMLKECIERLNKYVGEEKANSIISNSFFMVETGSDDLVNTYYRTPTRFFQYDIYAYTDLLLTEASAFVQKLYELGARRIGIISLPPVGCIPSQRTLAGGTERRCVEKYNEAAELFNTKLSAMADFQTNNLPDARVVFMDAYNPFLHILQHIHKYGFEVVDKGCCGTGMIEVIFLCNRWAPNTCTNVSKYVFWDSYHPTEKAYQIHTHQVLQNSIHSFF